jgi:hypothetical protein
MGFATAARARVWVGTFISIAVLALAALAASPSPAHAVDGLEFVYATGLDRGPISTSTEVRLTTSSDPAVLLEWQRAQVRTGAGAYHLRGVNITGGDADILNVQDKVDRSKNLGGLEVWMGAAFRFTSFPNAGLTPTWLMATSPTDGVAGADSKPLVVVTPAGKLRLTQSNTPSNFVEAPTALAKDTWYYLVLHGVNGVAKTQQLFVYDGTTSGLVQQLNLVGTVGGTFVNQLSKWGFGTYGDSTGLDYYLDDLFFARGSVNPGPVRVATRAPQSTMTSTGFSPVGSPSDEGAVATADADVTYLRGASSTGLAEFGLRPAGLTSGDTIYAIQALASQRILGRSGRDMVGVKIGGIESTAPMTLTTNYGMQQQVLRKNPVSGADWTPATADALTGIVRDTDGVVTEMRVTSVSWEVVFRDA